MVDVTTGIESEVVLEDSGGTDITEDLGIIQSAAWNFDLEVEQESSVGNVPTYQAAIEQAAQIDCSLDVAAPTLEVMKLMGTYTEDSGAGTFTVTLDDKLPTFTLKMQVTDSKTLVLKDVHWGSVELSVTKDSFIEFSFDGQALDAEIQDTTITTPDVTREPVQWLDASADIDGKNIGALESTSITYDREIESVRSITDTASGERRLPTQIIEKNKNFEFNSTIEISDLTAWEEAFSDDTTPLTIQDQADTITYTIDLGSQPGQFQLDEARVDSNEGSLENDAEIRTVAVEGVANKATISGSL